MFEMLSLKGLKNLITVTKKYLKSSFQKIFLRNFLELEGQLHTQIHYYTVGMYGI